MKRYKLLLCLISVVMTLLCGHVAASATVRSITLEKSGTLSEKTGAEAFEIDSLILAGPMDKADFDALWYMALKGKLSYLNLKNARPTDNEIPADAFCHFGDQAYDFSGMIGVKRLPYLHTVILPENLRKIGAGAFSHTDITSIDIPPTVEEIGQACFLACWKLAGKVVIPEGVSRIEDSTFQQCQNIQEVSLPSTLEYIGISAFDACSKMTLSNSTLPASVREMGAQAFYLTSALKEIELPAGLKIVPLACFQASGIEKVVIPPSVQVISDLAFQSCRSLKEIVFSEGVDRIAGQAFADDVSVEKIILPKSLSTAFNGAFANMPNLKEVYSLGTTPPWMCSDLVNGDSDGSDTDDGTIDGLPRSICAFLGTTPRDIPVYVPVGSLEMYVNAGHGWGWFSDFRECKDMPQLQAGIEETFNQEETASTMVYTNSNEIIIASSSVPQQYGIYSLDGRMIASGITNTDDTIINVSKGIYIVRVGRTSIKVIV